MAGELSLFKNSGTSLFTRDDSILASSLLLATNSLMNRSSEVPPTSTSTPTTATQLYSQFQNYYHLHENGIFPSSLILPSSTTATATDGEGYSSQLPNLTASLLRSRSDSLSRRASEPNLQKFGASTDNFNAVAVAAAATVAAASATADEDAIMQQKVGTEGCGAWQNDWDPLTKFLSYTSRRGRAFHSWSGFFESAQKGQEDNGCYCRGRLVL